MKKCPYHPGYKGKGKPRSKCFYCWSIWLSKRPMGQVRWQELSIKEIVQILGLVADYNA